MKKVNLPPIINNSNINIRPKSKNQYSSPKKYNNNIKRVDSGININKINNGININKTNNVPTKSYIEDMEKGSYNILVCVRCRPLSVFEHQLSSYETIRIMDNKMVILMDPIEYNGPSTVFKNRNREQAYAFDFAFDKNTSQNVVFENSTKFLIEGVINGFNATVFAYGATGAGKTYTMLGTDNNPGIMPLTLRELFNKVNSFGDREYKLKFWYLEIYNENIRDLLKFNDKKNNKSDNASNEYLDLREDPERGIVVSGITELNVTNSSDMLKILKRGNRNRTQEATGANETSSRSHAILQVSIEYKEKNSGINIEIKFSKLSLIDLAGSERASATQNRGIRLIEGANINRSLLTLGNCINALCDANIKGNKKPYIPYRDSKLTRLLKDSLGGNARTVMIANVSPSINTFEDTYNTLKYANRAKNIKTFVTRNVLNAEYHISNYVNIINNLKAEVSQLKQELERRDVQNNTYNNNFNLNNNNYNKYRNNKTYYDNENKSQIDDSYINNTINSNYLNNNYDFINAVNEMKKKCEEQVVIKQKIISILTEMNNLSNNSSKYKNLENALEHNQNRYKELGSIIEKLFNSNSAKSEFSEIQKDFLTLIMKNSSYKIQILDNKYNNILSTSRNEIRNNYIKELENQIKYRDEIISENQIDISENKSIKNLENLKQKYILNNTKYSAGGFRKYLPPISGKIVLNPNSDYNKMNNNTNIVKKSDTLHLDNMRNKFNIKSNNNKLELLDYKIKNNYSHYRIRNNSRIQSPTRKEDKKYEYEKYKYDPNLNKNRVYSSKKNKNERMNFKGLFNKRNKSFCLDNNSRNNSFDSKGGWDGTIVSDNKKKIKRKELISALDEKNKKRQQFLNKINS